MHCSSFEPLLDPFLDGELSELERSRLDQHLASCGSCAELLAEIRVIDALLVTPPAADLAPNFSFKVMAEVRSQPRPGVDRTPVVRVLVAYLAVAWIALGTFLASGSALARQAVSLYEGTFGQAGDVFATLQAAVARLCDHNVLGVGATMGAILVFDALLTVGAIVTYRAYLRRSSPGAVRGSEGLEA